jgi:EB1-like C-terminal motif
MKLRDIEILVQSQTEVLEAEGKEDEKLKAIQKILYETEVRSLRYARHSPFTFSCLA